MPDIRDFQKERYKKIIRKYLRFREQQGKTSASQYLHQTIPKDPTERDNQVPHLRSALLEETGDNES